MSEETPSISAGWYDDGHGVERWWDGTGWTERTKPREVEFAAGWYDDGHGTQRWWDGAQWTGQTESPVKTKTVDTKAVDQSTDEAHAAAAIARRDERQRAIEARRAGRDAARAQKALTKNLAVWTKAHAAWATTIAEAHRALSFVQDHHGEANGPIMMSAGERYYGSATVDLIDDRTQTTYVGRSQGFSIPVGSIGGHSVRYKVGASSGHVNREQVATIVDRGELFVTSKRIIFRGVKQTREHLLSKLISCDYPSPLHLALAVSNRQKVTRLRYAKADEFDLQMALAVVQADTSGRRDELLNQVQQTVNEIARHEPMKPTA